MKYFVLMTKGAGAGVIEAYPPKSPEAWMFQEGQSLLKKFPKAAAVKFSKNFPDARKLYDFQDNTLGAFIVSEQVRKVMEALEITNAEYLPVDIKDHKGEVVAKNYAILNLLGAEDAIDMEKSTYRLSTLDEGQIDRVKKLVVNKKGIHPGIKMMRCSTYLDLVLINEEVHQAFVKAGLTGFKAVNAEGWNGLEL